MKNTVECTFDQLWVLINNSRAFDLINSRRYEVTQIPQTANATNVPLIICRIEKDHRIADDECCENETSCMNYRLDKLQLGAIYRNVF